MLFLESIFFWNDCATNVLAEFVISNKNASTYTDEFQETDAEILKIVKWLKYLLVIEWVEKGSWVPDAQAFDNALEEDP